VASATAWNSGSSVSSATGGWCEVENAITKSREPWSIALPAAQADQRPAGESIELAMVERRIGRDHDHDAAAGRPGGDPGAERGRSARRRS
jgi:hypothetical protein